MNRFTFVVLSACLSFSTALAQPPSPALGSFPGPSGTFFRVWAPFANSAAVAGEFNQWAPEPMTRDASNGTWSVQLPAAQVGQRYKYVFNDQLWKRDARARRVEHSSGDSVLYDAEAFDWGDDTPPVIPRADLVLYQMHIGTFGGGDPPATFDDAIPHLDYLRSLGINGIQLMPINEFPGGRSWGYNPSDPFAIETDYGGPDAFKRFMRAAHARGLVVLADVVHNHYGPTDLDLWRYDGWSVNDLGGIYFYCDERIHTPWGSTRPDFGRPAVRDFIRDQVFMLIDEYRIDGFRWDSVYNILHSDLGSNPQGAQLLRDINAEMARTRPHVVRIAEDSAFDQDLGFEAQWDVGHRWALYNQLATADDLERDMGVIAGTLTDWPGFQRVIFTEAHDYIGRLNENRSRVPTMIHPEEPESIWARKRALLGAAVIFTTPGIPMLFQGQEMLETLAFHDDTPLRWERTNSHAGVVQAYTDLIHLRRDLRGVTPGLRGTSVRIHHVDHERKIIAFSRWHDDHPDNPVMVVANFSAVDIDQHDYRIEFPAPGIWHRQFNSDSSRYDPDFRDIGADQIDATGAPPSAPVDMGRYSLQIFSRHPPATDVGR
ncbi:MAG: alpha-amylase family glycosyl hydrolase [Kiritimatiellia bacterium]|nr:alpha-amylase family glycosyl hydrolase [Kiritimatiellia bacterium]